MSTYKKLGLGLIFAFISIGGLFMLPKTVTALETAEWANPVFQFVDRSTIIAQVGRQAVTRRDPGDNTPVTTYVGGQTITFTDGKPFDTILKYQGSDECKSTVELPGTFRLNNLGQFPSNPINSSSIHLKANDQNTGCKPIKTSSTIPSPDVGAHTYFNWVDSGTIELVDGSKTFSKNSAGVFIEKGQQDCADRIFVSGNKGVYFELDGKQGYDRNDFSLVKDLPTCKVFGVNSVRYAIFSDNTVERGSLDDLKRLAGLNPSIGKVPSAALPNGSGGGGIDGENTSDCVASDSTGLEWILCPVTSALSKAADTMNKVIEDQLRFNVGGNLANKDEGYVAWSLVKNIVSALVVIVMLVMVIAQAMGGGPFEAYTIKKLLPKLVIAVIAMQLSWEICKWLIVLSNHAGEGLKQLMLAPFGGGGNMDLDSILNRLDPAWAAITNGPAGGGAIFALLAGGIIVAFIALPATLVMAFSLFIGIFAALMVLLFRNVLIVALTIFAPLAFLAWTMPGTQTYWKLWRENFTKLLLMFPLIIAMLYTGRIFAWIVADAGVPGFIDYLTILVAYFGPYFLIFKSYKWGGSLLSSAGTGIAGARRGLTQANAPWLKTMGTRAQGNIANRYNQAQEKQRKAYEEVGKTEGRMGNLQKRIADRKARGLNTDAPERRLARLQGKRQLQQDSAMEAMNDNGKWQRAMWRIGAGKPLPTSRQQLETLARGNEYKTELVNQKQALIHNDYVEQLNSGSSVSNAKKYIRDKYGHGNMKQNAAGDWSAQDAFTERAFYNWLVDTRSAMELGDTNWRTRNGGMPDIGKTKGFIGMMNADPQRYAYVAQALPELQPFNQALGGGPKTEDFLVGGKSFAALERSDPATAAKIRAGGAAGQELAQGLADDSRHAKIFTNLEHTSDIAVWRPEQLQMMADNITKLKLAGVSTIHAENELKQILGELKSSKTPEAMGTLQRLMGGKMSARKAINGIMQDDKWLEDTLQVPVTTQEGVTRVTALPSQRELGDEEVRVTVRADILDGPAGSKRAQEVAQAISESPEYSIEAQGTERSDIFQIVKETREAAQNSRNQRSVSNFNAMLDLAKKMANERAQRVIKQATAQSLPTDELMRIEKNAARERELKINLFESMKLPPPSDDPTVLTVEHSEGTPGSTIITPGNSGYSPPRSSDLPK